MRRVLKLPGLVGPQGIIGAPSKPCSARKKLSETTEKLKWKPLPNPENKSSIKILKEPKLENLLPDNTLIVMVKYLNRWNESEKPTIRN